MKEIEEQLRARPDLTRERPRPRFFNHLDSIARRARETRRGLWRVHGEEIIQQDPSYAGGYYARGWASDSEAILAAASQQFGVRKTLERADQSSGTAKRSPKNSP